MVPEYFYFSGPHKIFVKTYNATTHLYQVMKVYIKSKQKHNKNGGSGALPQYEK